MTHPTDAAITAALRTLAAERAPRSFCPSEVARRLASDWRPLMPAVRRVAAATEGIVAMQGGREVDATAVRGPIRLAMTARRS